MIWEGRYDSDDVRDRRLWQLVNKVGEESKIKARNYSFIGFASQEGVRRNLGRMGAIDGSNAIRKALSSIPFSREDTTIVDFGDVRVEDNQLEKGQSYYSKQISDSINEGYFPIGLGGGHEIAIGTFNGIKQSKKYKNKKIGIINFDAHLDMRSYNNQPNSGTSFKQIADEYSPFKYMIIGFQEIGNTQRLIDLAHKHNVQILNREDIDKNSVETSLKQIDNFINKVDCLYISFCMDVFDSNDAPGVSAPSTVGIDKKKVIELFDNILKTKKVAAVDFAEVNPSLDIDNRTAKLAAFLIHRIIK